MTQRVREITTIAVHRAHADVAWAHKPQSTEIKVRLPAVRELR
jgi:hypothetical protein